MNAQPAIATTAVNELPVGRGENYIVLEANSLALAIRERTVLMLQQGMLLGGMYYDGANYRVRVLAGPPTTGQDVQP